MPRFLTNKQFHPKFHSLHEEAMASMANKYLRGHSFGGNSYEEKQCYSSEDDADGIHNDLIFYFRAIF